MIDGNNVFDQPVKNDQRTYNITKLATGQGDDHTTDCLFHCVYRKNIFFSVAYVKINELHVAHT